MNQISSCPRYGFSKHLLSILIWSIVSAPLLAAYGFVALLCTFRYKGSPTAFEELIAAPIVLPGMFFEKLLRPLGPTFDDAVLVMVPVTWGVIIHLSIRLAGFLRRGKLAAS